MDHSAARARLRSVELRYRPSLVVKIRIWPVLLVGFGTLIVLIAFSGFSALQRASASYAGTTKLYVEELQTEQMLGTLRSDILLSAIAIRDLLLIPTGAERKRQELRTLERSSRFSLQALDSSIPAADRYRLQALALEVNAYWQLLGQLPTSEGKLQAQLNESFLRGQILPHRQAVLALVGQIEDLTRDSIRKARSEIDRRQSELPSYVAEIVGATLLVGLAIALTSLLRISHLERTAAEQHRSVLNAEEQLRRLSQQLVRAQEEEKKSISRDLHDQIGQVLTAVRIGVGNLEEALQNHEAPERVRAQLDQTKRLSEQALRSVRDIAMGLRPAMLDDLGLGAALEWQGRQFSRLCNIPVSIEVEGDLEGLSEDQKTCVYRVVQEALNNIAKHAEATAIRVSVASQDAKIEIEVRDNGTGFDVQSARLGGIGIVGMIERARELGGHANVESHPGEGTSVSVWLPRNHAEPA